MPLSKARLKGNRETSSPMAGLFFSMRCRGGLGSARGRAINVRSVTRDWIANVIIVYGGGRFGNNGPAAANQRFAPICLKLRTRGSGKPLNSLAMTGIFEYVISSPCLQFDTLVLSASC